MRYGVVLPVEGPSATPESIAAMATAAERLGADSVWVTDRILMPWSPPGGYPYSADRGAVAFDPHRLWLEAVATMGFVAGLTSRVRIGTNVLVLPYRSPVVLAHELATLDRLSGGRMQLGVGIGWMTEEFAALGVDRTERGSRTDEGIDLLRALWSTDGPVEFDGRFTRITNMSLPARPVQAGGIPILVGGNSDAAFQRVALRGDGWLGTDLDVAATTAAIAALRTHADRAGRSIHDLTVSMRRRVEPVGGAATTVLAGNDPARLADEFAALHDAGVDLIVVDVMMMPDGIEALEHLASEVLPALR
jgi:probable F420-dependent oxidoreductase